LRDRLFHFRYRISFRLRVSFVGKGINCTNSIIVMVFDMFLEEWIDRLENGEGFLVVRFGRRKGLRVRGSLDERGERTSERKRVGSEGRFEEYSPSPYG